MADPRMYADDSLWKRAPSADVQITSARFMFIHESIDCNRPLYVSPPFSSTSMGDPVAARNSDSGNCAVGMIIGNWGTGVVKARTEREGERRGRERDERRE